MSLGRRDLLKTATALSLAAVAGCTDVLDDGESPGYAEAIPHDGADDDAGVFFVHIDAEWLRAFDGEEELPYAEELSDSVDLDVDPDTPPVDADPLLAYPTAGLVVGTLGIGYGDDIKLAREAIIEEGTQIEGVLDDLEPMAPVAELGDSAVVLSGRIWIDPNESSYGGVRAQLVEAVKERFDAEGLSMPYPNTELSGPLEITKDGGTAEAAAD